MNKPEGRVCKMLFYHDILSEKLKPPGDRWFHSAKQILFCRSIFLFPVMVDQSEDTCQECT